MWTKYSSLHCISVEIEEEEERRTVIPLGTSYLVRETSGSIAILVNL